MMKAFLKNTIAALNSVRLTPLIILLLLCPNRQLVWADMDRFYPMWANQGIYQRRHSPNLMARLIQFIIYMTWVPEFRNVFYFRTGMAGKLLSIFCRPMSSLIIERKMKVGPGLFIIHGEGTFVLADEIGQNCTVYQQVTIGNVEGGMPTIGNNVTIYAGAKILGRVRVGDNVSVGANSVVIKNVPPNVTVLGVPAVVVWKKKPADGQMNTLA
jgi:serine O-acetyltransferase